MSFLRLRDYPTYIQSQQLAQISKDPSGSMTNDEVRQSAELDAIEEVSEYLQQKYDVTLLFTDTIPYDPTLSYAGNARIDLEAPAFVAQAQYNVNALTLYTDGNVYQCTAQTAPLWLNQNYVVGNQVLYTDGNYYQCSVNTVGNAPPTNATYWNKITPQIPGNAAFYKMLGYNYQLFYLKYPYTYFDITCIYKVGDIRFWKGKVYQCLIPSSPLDGEARIQYDDSTQYPFPNAFPDDPNVGAQQWGAGVAYSVTGLGPADTVAAWVAGTYALGVRKTYNGVIWEVINPAGTNAIPGADIINWQPETWVKGDNRNRRLVENLVHLTLWKLHSNIAPQNVPMLREKNHIKAIEWLEDVKKGNKAFDALTMQVLEPPQGGRLLIASRPAQNNRW